MPRTSSADEAGRHIPEECLDPSKELVDALNNLFRRHDQASCMDRATRGPCQLHQMLAGPVEHDDLLFETISQAIPLRFQVVVGLQVEPELFGSPKVTCEAQGRVCGHGARSVDDLVDSAWRNADILREAVLGYAESSQKVLEQDLARVDRLVLSGGHKPSVVIDDFNLVCVALNPAEAYPPLVVDPYAELSRAPRRTLTGPNASLYPTAFSRAQ